MSRQKENGEIPPQREGAKENAEPTTTSVVTEVRAQGQETSVPVLDTKAVEVVHEKIKNIPEAERNYDEILERLEASGELGRTYTKIMERLNKDPEFLRELKELGLADGVTRDEPETEVDGVKIRWRKEGGNGGGTYNFVLHRVFVDGQYPTKKAMLSVLARRGFLHKNIRVLIHEVTHSTQHATPIKGLFQFYTKTFKSLLRGDPKGAKDTELLEVHARRTDNMTKGFEEDEIMTTVLMETKLDIPIKMYQVKPEKIAYAIKAVDRLFALGFPTTAIGKIIEHCDAWDAKGISYPTIEKIIHEEMEKQGLMTEADINKKVVEFKKSKIEARGRAQAIAREELEKTN